MILKLSDGSAYTIADFTSSAFFMETETFNEAVDAYQVISRYMDNVTVEKDGEVVYSATGLHADGVQITNTETGYYATIYYHGAKASVDDEYATIGKILMGEEE